ncbi:FAD-binding oxidoreductase [Kitasatospora sp. NPDC058965]|uniref:FAD-binding oxidoreductase n=1 Tax=Kitasatospora sp. NPDC058965 TaxID=3346682 RepID=UPI0036BF434C
MNPTSEAHWQRLERSTTGRLLHPGQPGFTAATAPFNQRWSATVPARVLCAADVADVRRAVAWAADTGTPIVPRGGGHGYAGQGVTTGLVVDLRALDAVTVDPASGLVSTAGGALMAGVHAALQPHDLAFPLGNGNGVGIAGLALGGGSAAVSRKLGLTADAMVSTTLVTADGELVTCDARQHPDLFWACRGGGGGNFGINVSFTFQAVPVVDSATCLLLWHGEQAPEVFEVLQEVMRKAPEECSIRLGVSVGADGRATVSAVGQHLGPAADLRELLAPVLAAADPFRQEIADRTYWEAKDYLAHETSGGAFACRTHFATEPLPPDAVAAALAQLARRPATGNPDGAGLALFGWGGAINRVAPADTAFVHRHAQYLVSLDTSWTEQDPPAAVRANLDWLAELDAVVAPHTAEGAYLNFADPDLADWRTAYYGANYPRLLEVKRRVDPAGLFRHAQGIGS